MLKPKGGRPSPDTAAALALKALAFLAADGDALQRLMDQSGMDVATLRARAAEPQMLSSVLDFLLRQEDLLTDFCKTNDIDPKAVHLALHVLDGGHE